VSRWAFASRELYARVYVINLSIFLTVAIIFRKADLEIDYSLALHITVRNGLLRFLRHSVLPISINQLIVRCVHERLWFLLPVP